LLWLQQLSDSHHVKNALIASARKVAFLIFQQLWSKLIKISWSPHTLEILIQSQKNCALAEVIMTLKLKHGKLKATNSAKLTPTLEKIGQFQLLMIVHAKINSRFLKPKRGTSRFFLSAYT
jgi:hypothetical protein